MLKRDAQALHERTGSDMYMTTISSEAKIQRIVSSLESIKGTKIVGIELTGKNMYNVLIDFCGVNSDEQFSEKQEEVYKILKEEKAKETGMRKFRARGEAIR
jgi:hypothetical protein